MLGVLRFGLVGGFPDKRGAAAGAVAMTYWEGMGGGGGGGGGGAASGWCAACRGGTRRGQRQMVASAKALEVGGHLQLHPSLHGGRGRASGPPPLHAERPP